MLEKLAILAMAALLPMAGQGFAKDAQVRRTTEPGKAVEIWGHSSMRADCATKAPAVAVVRQPSHGAVAISEGPRTLSGNKGAYAECNGKTGYGVRIVYAPQPGFVGNDRLTYTVRFETGAEVKVSAIVRVGRPPSGEEGWHPATAGTDRQAALSQSVE